MKKRIFSVLLSIVMTFSLVACGSSNTVSSQTISTDDSEATTTIQNADASELALVAVRGTIDDKSFNQGAWEGLVQYAEENGKKYKYYQSQEDSTSAYIKTIQLAIEGGAKLVICPGYLLEVPVYEVQDRYPDVKFILLDGAPHDENGNYKTSSNVMAVTYQEDQAGFLAGYAAVKDGNTNLGFMGGMAVPSVVRFGFGYLQGIDAAARELDTNCNVMYNYTGAFEATPEAQNMAASWYTGGTEVIFGCGGLVGNSVMSAAESKNKQEDSFVAKVIGVDVDQYSESDTVITSAIKQLANSVYSGITDFYNDEFKGGTTTTFDVHNNGVGAAMEHAKFNTFSLADYDEIYSKLQNGEYQISNSTENTNPRAALSLTNTNITYVE